MNKEMRTKWEDKRVERWRREKCCIQQIEGEEERPERQIQGKKDETRGRE